MNLEEEGVVVEERGELALVRATRSSHCSGCSAAGHCQAGGDGQERTVEALNAVGARRGDKVVLSVPSGRLLKAAFEVYMVPVLGLLAGAALAQFFWGRLFGPSAAGTAAGVGGVAGVVVTVFVQRLRRRGGAAGAGLRPRIVRVL